MLAARHRRDAIEVDAHRAAHVAQRRARPIADHHRGERGAVAAVLAVDVLDHLLAALVLEVDVDVGRLVALGADEPLEQQRHAIGVDLGDTQAITDGGVGRAAAALAQDLLLARPAHHVGHGEEVRLEPQSRDQRQLMLDGLAHLERHAVRKPLACTGLGERAQPTRRRVAFGHDLFGVFVAQLVERERARRGDAHRGRQPLGRIQRRQALARAQMRLGIGFEREAALGHRPAQPRRGQRILQRLARPHVHQHVACGRQVQAGEFSQPLGGLDARRVVRAMQQRHHERRTFETEPGLEPHRVRELRLERQCCIDHHQRKTIGQTGQIRCMRHAAFDVAGQCAVAAFDCAASRHGDPLREIAVAAARLRQQHQPRSIAAAGSARRQPHLGADDQVQAEPLGLAMCAHHAGQRALVGDGQRRVAELVRTGNQLFRVRRPGEKSEVAAAMQLGVGGQALRARREPGRHAADGDADHGESVWMVSDR